MSKSSLRIVSFNILGSHSAPPHEWERRCPLVAALWNRLAPDIVGLQEVRAHQRADLQKLLPDYDFFGLSRSHPGDEGDEQCAIAVRRERFDCRDSGHFWLSETPEIPASRSWNTVLPRMVTHMKLQERASGALLAIFNTHFDNLSSPARLHSAALLRARLQEIERQSPQLSIFVTGDFNEDASPAQSPSKDSAYQVLTASGDRCPGLRDAWLESSPGDKSGGTFHDFKPQNGPRLDWILCNSVPQIESARVVCDEPESLVASDHFGVTASFSLPCTSPRAS